MDENRTMRIEQLFLVTIVLLLSICLMLSIYVLSELSSIILPFVFAIFLTFMLNPAIDYFDKLRFPHIISIIISSTIVLLFIVFIGAIIKDSVDSFLIEFPKYEGRIDTITEKVTSLLHLEKAETFGASTETMKSELELAFENFSIPKLLGGIVTAISNILSNAVLVFIILLFLLLGRHSLTSKIRVAFQDNTSEKIISILNNMESQIQTYLVAKSVISLITSAISMIILYLFGVPFVAIWGILIFLLNFIPNVGSIIATILPLILALVKFEDPMMVLWLGLILISIQFSIGNFVEPKIMGKQVDLSPVMILFSLILWGWIWGIIGMFLAVPLTAMVKIVLGNIPKLKFLSILMSSGPET